MRLLWFCYRVVVETSGCTSVPNSKLSTPPGCTCTRYFFFFKHALVSRPISYLALAQMQSMHSMNSFSFFSFFFSFFFFFFFFFSSSMQSVILNREYAMKFVMLSIFSPFTTSFKFWARFASHVISYLTDVTSVIVFPIL